MSVKKLILLSSVKQYHGGTNFGRSAGGPFITTSYDYDAPIDEYGKDNFIYLYTLGSFKLITFFNPIGLIRQPKYGHLTELHKAVKLCEKALVSADPIQTSLGTLQQVFGHLLFEFVFMHFRFWQLILNIGLIRQPKYV